VKNFWKYVSQSSPDSCWEWKGARNKLGYGILGRHADGKHTHWLAHRFHWHNEIGPIPEGMCVLHKCDNPPCVNLDHLFLGTRIDNSNDKVSKGRQFISAGVKNGRARLTEKDIPQIRILIGLGYKDNYIANLYNVADATIWQIRKGNNWKHVEE
jgi:hypothetical protein